MLSDIQRKKFLHLFSVLDADKSGSLEAEDMQRLGRNLAAGRGWKAGDTSTAALLARFEAQWQTMTPFAESGKIGKDGFLKYQEALVGTPAAYEITTKALSDFVFFALDGDGDGKIGIGEHRAFFKAYGIDEKQSDVIFPKLDLDKNGYLTQDEVYELVKQYFFGSDPEKPGNYIFGMF